MAKKTELQPDNPNLLSISKISDLTGIARQTIAQRITGIRPRSIRSGHPVYFLRDVGAALFAKETVAISSNPDQDPAKLPPVDRDRWYSSEIKRLDFEEQMGALVRVEDMAQAIGVTFKKLALMLDTLPDVLERDVGMTPQQISAMCRIIDTQRSDLYAQITDTGTDD